MNFEQETLQTENKNKITIIVNIYIKILGS